MSAAPNFVYFDLETQKSAAEVGGWHNKRAMKVALGVTYSTQRGTYEIYREDDVYALLQELQRADQVIGYNVVDFDFEVLAPYAVFDLSQVPVLDLMRDVEKTIGLRVGLDAISEQLRASNDYYAQTNSDDLILDKAELAWLKKTLGSRIAVYDHGGHLGNLGSRQQIADMLDMLSGNWTGPKP